jgi:hypothetical protein
MNDSNRDTTAPPPLLPRRPPGRVWLIVGVGFACLLLIPTFFAVRWFFAAPGSGTGSAVPKPREIVASFRADFLPEHPKAGWRYCWNDTGPVGDANGYVDLVWNGTAYAPPELGVAEPSPLRYLRMSNTGGHPGQGPAQTASSGYEFGYSVIIAFTVPDSGRYVIGHSSISRRGGPKYGAVQVQVFVNDRASGGEVYCRSREGVPFDCQLGRLSAGDIIYVAVGPDETNMNDTFELDFGIGRL